MTALHAHEWHIDEPVPWLAVLETAADGTCEVTSAPIGGPADPALFDYDTFQGNPPLSELLDWMEENCITQLWVHLSFALAHDLLAPGHALAFVSDATTGNWHISTTDERAQGWITCWRDGVYGKRAIYLPAMDDRAIGQLWCEALDGKTLLAAVLRYNQAVGRAYAKSPAVTGRQLLRALHAGHAHWLEGPGPEMPPARTHTERRYDWCRPLLQSERHAAALVSYDKNAMYLGACAALECGYDEPEHLDTLSMFDDRCSLPGYYRVDWEHHLSPLPPVLTGRREPDGTIWVTQPTLTLAIAEREVFSIREAYIWPHHRRLLQPWYARLRDARAQLRAEAGEPARIARDALKMTYSQTIAQLDGYWLRDGQPGVGLYRPHWRHSVIAQARTNLYRALAKVYSVTGVAPFAIVEDACYFLVSDAQEAILRGIIPVDDTLGGFKRQDRLAAPTAIVEAIEGAEVGREMSAFTRALVAQEG